MIMQLSIHPEKYFARPTAPILNIKLGNLFFNSLVCVNFIVVLLRWGTSSYQNIYGNGHFQAILDIVKFIDPFLILLMTVIVVFVKIISFKGIIKATFAIWLIALACTLLSGFIGVVYAKPGLYYAVQSWLFLMRPLLLFFVFSSLFIAYSNYVYLLRCIVCYLIFSSTIAIYQSYQPYAFISADFITGLFEHSHTQAVTMYVMAILLHGFPQIIPRRILRYLLIGLFLYIGYLGRNDKATAFLIVLIFFAFVLPEIWKLIRRPKMMLVILVVWWGFVLFFLFGNQENNSIRKTLTGNMIELIEIRGGTTNLVKDVGLIQMISFYGSRAINDPIIALYGLGLGNFGSSSALAKFQEGKGTKWQQTFFAWDITPDLQNQYRRLGAISYNSSLIGIILGELGIIGFVGFIVLFMQPLIMKCRSYYYNVCRSLLHLKIAYLLIFTISVVATSSSAGWENEAALTLICSGFGVLFSS